MTHLLLTTRLVGFVCANTEHAFVSERTLRSRLSKLLQAGLIQRTKFAHTGEYLYCLTKTGAEFLTHHDPSVEIPSRALSLPKVGFQAHEFDVSRFWIKFFSDSKKIGMPLVQFWRDGSFVYHASDKQLIPDGTALLRIRKQTKVFFLELDRSTQTSGASGNKEAVIRRKLLHYKQLFYSYRYHPDLEPYSPNQMRVIFVCKTKKRAENLKAVAESLSMGNLACFMSLDRFLDITNPNSAEGWDFRSANMFSAPLFSFPNRSPPAPLL